MEFTRRDNRKYDKRQAIRIKKLNKLVGIFENIKNSSLANNGPNDDVRIGSLSVQNGIGSSS
jgi:hypothetical protein